MNRKLLGILGIALVALVSGVAVWSMTWTSCCITMTADSACTGGDSANPTIGIAQFEDCDCTIPFTSHDWDGVLESEYYECVFFVKNIGAKGVYLTYLPTQVEFDKVEVEPGKKVAQTKFHIEAWVVEAGTPCQVNKIDPELLPEKDPTVCDAGYYLYPGKVIKLDVILHACMHRVCGIKPESLRNTYLFGQPHFTSIV